MAKFDQLKQVYTPKNIFNCDETALYYKSVPKKRFVTYDDNLKGIKFNKTRITVLLTCNMVGDKLNPIVIGHYKTPIPLRNFSTEDLGVTYTHSSKAWMTSSLFSVYLKQLNGEMSKENRKILLLLDNASSHPNAYLSNIELLFYLKNTTSLIQPLDMGIIKAFKNHYFNELINSIDYDFLSNDFLGFNSINIKDAIILISIAWDNINKETITNCFKKGVGNANTENLIIENHEYNISTIVENTIEKVIEESLEFESMEKIFSKF
ncbi:Tigger transposable element-derived protein 1 [Dictyocoela muelleri]|nr:Tigger transposable element-derived protein 1 [Dictyocoela muelleri]